MPFILTVAQNIKRSHPDFSSAYTDLLELRYHGDKPRLFYAASFASPRCELDDEGAYLRDYTDMSYCDFEKLLPHFESAWSVKDNELSSSTSRVVDVFVLLCGRTFHLGDIHYPRNEMVPSHLRVHTHLLRVTQGLMDPGEL